MSCMYIDRVLDFYNKKMSQILTIISIKSETSQGENIYYHYMIFGFIYLRNFKKPFLASAEGFGVGQGFFCAFGKTKLFLNIIGSFGATFFSF